MTSLSALGASSGHFGWLEGPHFSFNWCVVQELGRPREIAARALTGQRVGRSPRHYEKFRWWISVPGVWDRWNRNKSHEKGDARPWLHYSVANSLPQRPPPRCQMRSSLGHKKWNGLKVSSPSSSQLSVRRCSLKIAPNGKEQKQGGWEVGLEAFLVKSVKTNETQLQWCYSWGGKGREDERRTNEEEERSWNLKRIQERRWKENLCRKIKYVWKEFVIHAEFSRQLTKMRSSLSKAGNLLLLISTC